MILLAQFRNVFQLNSYNLKIIAIVTMLLDHIGKVFLPDIFVLQLLGRIAFVLFCFLLVEGYFHTRNVKKYMLRLAIWAIISEIPYDLLFYNGNFSFFHFNVFFTLLLGLICTLVLDAHIRSDLKVLFVVVLYTLAHIFRFDYGYLGVLQIVFFYLFRSSMLKKFVSVGILNILAYSRITIQAGAVLAFLPIYLYNGKLGKKAGDWFYAIYAGHLLLFWIIKKLFF